MGMLNSGNCEHSANATEYFSSSTPWLFASVNYMTFHIFCFFSSGHLDCFHHPFIDLSAALIVFNTQCALCSLPGWDGEVVGVFLGCGGFEGKVTMTWMRNLNKWSYCERWDGGNLCSWWHEAFIGQMFANVPLSKTVKGQSKRPIFCALQNLSVF